MGNAGGYREPAPRPPDFPPRVAEADPERTLHQAFGWTAGALVFAMALVFAAIVLITLSQFDLAVAPFVGAGLGLAGLAGALVIEVRRRRRRVSIVLLEDRILVYVNGALAGAMACDQLVRYHLHGFFTHRHMLGWFALAFVGMMGLFAGLDTGSVVAFVIALSLFTTSLLGLTSTYQTRWKYVHYWVGPQERVMYRLRDLQNVSLSARWFSVA